ncbi:MAG: GTPase HflX [Candidatus Binatus sp.]|uniref:GTPase HflX n=1 Tax=Candidatus Binatus sp. TaxID=2811406 RepID=UPI002721232C|nr:GTPase HflX [Candidatus Binatus sp.]MDO8431753.1 GTPase HflX [Candidatus Binatus sp.]
MHDVSNEHHERAILVGIELGSEVGIGSDESLEELKSLTESAGAEVAATVRQRLKAPDPRTFIGKGKAAEVHQLAQDKGANVAIFDDALSPAQARNLENELKLRVIDRSQLILDIFAQRARTLEGKLQVEIAQLSYLQPRLTRQWSHLSRVRGGGAGGGGVGTRGPGETQLEVDRRRLRERLTRLRARLREVERTRAIQRRRRLEAPYPTVALVGYTNSGKSTLMNALTDAGVETANRPFSTLDPTIRRLKLPGKMNVMLVDTVGFIHRLPHMLIDAFKATLEEVRTATMLLHVVDASSPLAPERMAIVDQVLEEIGAGAVPRLIVMNKADLLGDAPRRAGAHDSISISAKNSDGLDELLAAIARQLTGSREEISVTFPAGRGDLLAMARRDGEVLSEEYTDGLVSMRARVSAPVAGRLRKAAVESPQNHGSTIA